MNDEVKSVDLIMPAKLEIAKSEVRWCRVGYCGRINNQSINDEKGSNSENLGQDKSIQIQGGQN